MARVYFWLADPSLSRAQACARLGVEPAKADDMVDTVHATVGRLPTSLKKVAGYTTGTPDIQWTAADWDRFPHAAKVRLDQSGNPNITGDVPIVRASNAEDVEAGAMLAQTAARGAKDRASWGLDTTIYAPGSLLPVCESACRALGLELGGLVAVQWAWPSTNPDTVIPGTNVKLRDANADLSVTLPTWNPVPSRRRRRPLPKLPKPPAHLTIPVTAGGVGTGLVAVLKASGVPVTATEGAAIAAFLPSLVGLLKTFANRKA